MGLVRNQIVSCRNTSSRASSQTATPSSTVSIRRVKPDDYPAIAAHVDAWSRGRFVGAALPRSFLQHFGDTSLLLTEGDHTIGVLVGFRSQTSASTAYIHFVAIAPGSRRKGKGRILYQGFCDLAARLGCIEVQSIAPPINSGLIAFHRQLGFDVVDGGGFSCGIAVYPDYAGPGQHRVLFRKLLPAARAVA